MESTEKVSSGEAPKTGRAMLSPQRCVAFGKPLLDRYAQELMVPAP